MANREYSWIGRYAILHPNETILRILYPNETILRILLEWEYSRHPINVRKWLKTLGTW